METNEETADGVNGNNDTVKLEETAVNGLSNGPSLRFPLRGTVMISSVIKKKGKEKEEKTKRKRDTRNFRGPSARNARARANLSR